MVLVAMLSESRWHHETELPDKECQGECTGLSGRNPE